jgi:integrase
MKLSKSSVARIALSTGKSDEIFFDDELPGFGLRIRAGGSRRWVIHYRQAGLQRRHTIGSAASMDVEEARRRARKVLVAVDDGKDPAAEKATKRAAAALVLSGVMRDYLAAKERWGGKPRSIEENRRHLDKLWKPFHSLALGALSRPVIAARLRAIAQHNGPVTADRARSTLSAMFSWAIGEGLCESNPVIGTNRASDDKPRERVLSDAELVLIWNAAPPNAYGRIVKLLMLTAQRRDEIGGLRWPEVTLEPSPMIVLPGERTKNHRAHEVPLSAAAVAVLEAQPRIIGRRNVFSGTERGFSGWGQSKAALDAACGVRGWRLHDLRRTAATRMADLGVQPHVIEAVLNHISGHKAGVAGIYNRSSYAAEKRAALDLWANHLMVAIAKAEGSNVVELPARAS